MDEYRTIIHIGIAMIPITIGKKDSLNMPSTTGGA
jgi:hypothetical protein